MTLVGIATSGHTIPRISPHSPNAFTHGPDGPYGPYGPHLVVPKLDAVVVVEVAQISYNQYHRLIDNRRFSSSIFSTNIEFSDVILSYFLLVFLKF